MRQGNEATGRAIHTMKIGLDDALDMLPRCLLLYMMNDG